MTDTFRDTPRGAAAGPTYEDQVTDEGNRRMRKVSGEVDDSRPLVAFLYELARDEVTTGALEERIDRLVTTRKTMGNTYQFTNGWLAQWAQDVADRLTGGSE